MSKNLIIVESPAKAKTINKFLGDDYVVSSSYGHIRDLPDKGVAMDIKNHYEPKYEVNEDKEKVVKELKKAGKGCKRHLWQQTTARKAIAWHLCHVLISILKRRNVSPIRNSRRKRLKIGRKSAYHQSGPRRCASRPVVYSTGW
jgi:DNA topoisomerase-1